MLTKEQKNQFSEILEHLGSTLDISETQYQQAVKSYVAVGEWLSTEDSSLAPYHPEILPQGSFMIGTMIKPISEKDDLDIDLVCQLKGKNPSWTQYDLKQKVGDRLKAHEKYKRMLAKEGRRCWKLIYPEATNYHMDILPSIVSSDYRVILEKAFSDIEKTEVDNLAIRITCSEQNNYYTDKNPDTWLKSNPFGYGKWFLNRATLSMRKAFSLNESIQPVPSYRKEKLPLQRVVQILKRHRDMMFDGHEHKVISIIITTLAAKAYNKETSILEALLNIIAEMPKYVEERYSLEHGRNIKWISNPVNEEENFADRWVKEPKREEAFYRWMKQVNIDIQNALGQRGLNYIMESLEKPFGKNVVTKAFSDYAESTRLLREEGKQFMAASTGTLGAVGVIKNLDHKFHGTE